VAKALKPSLRREFIVQQTNCEDFFSLNANTVAGGDDFFVDDLFDFSDGSLHYEQQDYVEEKKGLSFLSKSKDQGEDDSNSNSTGVSYDSLFSAELAVPVTLSLSLFFVFLTLFLFFIGNFCFLIIEIWCRPVTWRT